MFARLIGEWMRGAGSVALSFVLTDEFGLSTIPDRPGLRAALVFGIPLLSGVLGELTRIQRPRVDDPD
jgi:hypothetical protein